MCACGEDEIGARSRAGVDLQSFLLESTRADDRAGLQLKVNSVRVILKVERE